MTRPMGLLAVVAFLAALILLAATPQWAYGHYQPGQHNAVHAIQLSWCGRSNASCWRGAQAVRVARCEASARYWYSRPQAAVNGQYLGMFQMGHWARSNYGHGPSVWHQARAAHRNWLENGWGQWECASILGIR